MNRAQVLILDSNGVKNPLYDAWTDALPCAHAVITDYDAGWVPPPSCSLLVTAQSYREPEYGILKRAVETGLPTLVVADGILEYRNTWENPQVAAGCMFQPVISHKVACLGRSQMRALESWGNLGKCELVGAPRFDRLIGSNPRSRPAEDAFRILVMTSRTPGFTPEQITLTKRSVSDMKYWHSTNNEIAGNRIEVIWRLAPRLAQELDVGNRLTHFQGSELANILAMVDAVITTPSTSMLEAMFYGLPVALLDYHNNPLFVPSSWHISAPRHFDQVLPQLLNPPAAKMLYQDMVFHDALECRSPAAPRMVRLITEMLRLREACERHGRPLEFPSRILQDPQNGHHMPEESFDLAKLYPNHPVFSELDRAKLQVQVSQLQLQVANRKTDLQLTSVIRKSLRYFPGPKKLKRFWNLLGSRSR